MKDFEQQARQALHELYDQIKGLEQQAKQLRTELEEKVKDQTEDFKNQEGELYEKYRDTKNASTAAFYDIRQGVEQASVALREALKKASYHFK